MQLTTPMRRALIAGAAVTALFTGAGGAAAAPPAPVSLPVPLPLSAPAGASAPLATHSPYGRLRPLAALSAERLALGDLVAAAKWGTGSPIDDPAREQQVLDAVAERARQLGADPEATVRIFRDQIEASKIVQRGLHRRWDADPAQAPAGRPDLGEIRKEINRVNGELVRALAATPEARSAPSCGPLLTVAAARERRERQLDTLHTAALARSLRSVCEPRV
ncbi:chorismate mutase [Streptomyces sp. NPDC001339]|uniref:chorismate mutase n=1 Tax=Streptomyces sp. NPDC001339 TaxID=3364563 RepID=UPI003694F532